MGLCCQGLWISRTRMAPLPTKPSMKDRILETADRLFYLRGIRAVGVDTIAAEIGISKRTLYNHFPSKHELIAAYLERRFTRAPASDKPPVEQILGTFDRLERGFASKGFRGWCARQNSTHEEANNLRSPPPAGSHPAVQTGLTNFGFFLEACSAVSVEHQGCNHKDCRWATARKLAAAKGATMEDMKVTA